MGIDITRRYFTVTEADAPCCGDIFFTIRPIARYFAVFVRLLTKPGNGYEMHRVTTGTALPKL